MTDILIASYGLLWITVLLLAAGVVALARQIGLLYGRLGQVPARVENAGPAIGEHLAPLVVADIYGAPVTIPTPNKNSLLVFVSRTCSLCGRIMLAVRSLMIVEQDI